MIGYQSALLDPLAAAGWTRLHPDLTKITVGLATCGLAAGAGAVYEALEARVRQRGLSAAVASTGCIGFCQGEPLVDVRLPGGPRLLFDRVTRTQARALVDDLARGRVPHERAWAWIDDEGGPAGQLPLGWEGVRALSSAPFFSRQKKIALRNCGHIDPCSLAEYVARGGYCVLARVLCELTPSQVIDAVTRSGIRGRGGGGFPTGRKWQTAATAPGDVRYLICNGDEGDPGAYMDRTLLESDPHSVLEGMIIGAYAVGAHQAYAYVRDEYPLAVERLSGAIAQAQAQGLLGKNIMGSGFDLEVKLVRGAGAFVCGEETALISSIETGCGEPRPKPPYPAVAGLWGKPTVINNVKTWATVPAVLAQGPEAYAATGAPGNAGTVVFSLVGQIANTGLVEIPLGTTLRELLFEIGGGAPEGRAIKAVQTGGPSGGCLPSSLFDLPIQYETMKAAGSIMGSGGLVVLDDTACMVDVARYFLDFTRTESCGKCTACREGTRHMLQILTGLCKGQGNIRDIALLEELGQAVVDGSLCGLGQTAPNPVLSTLRYFLDEYEAHAVEHRCPAGKCRMEGVA